jgi:hypothetical protein
MANAQSSEEALRAALVYLISQLGGEQPDRLAIGVEKAQRALALPQSPVVVLREALGVIALEDENNDLDTRTATYLGRNMTYSEIARQALATTAFPEGVIVGYRHLYHTYDGSQVWRFNDGREVNGSRPIRSEPVYATPQSSR